MTPEELQRIVKNLDWPTGPAKASPSPAPSAAPAAAAAATEAGGIDSILASLRNMLLAGKAEQRGPRIAALEYAKTLYENAVRNESALTARAEQTAQTLEGKAFSLVGGKVMASELRRVLGDRGQKAASKAISDALPDWKAKGVESYMPSAADVSVGMSEGASAKDILASRLKGAAEEAKLAKAAEAQAAKKLGGMKKLGLGAGAAIAGTMLLSKLFGDKKQEVPPEMQMLMLQRLQGGQADPAEDQRRQGRDLMNLSRTMAIVKQLREMTATQPQAAAGII